MRFAAAASIATSASTSAIPSVLKKRLVAVAHDAVPGRVRLHVRGLLNSPVLKTKLEDELLRLPYVLLGNANPRTGTLLVFFAKEISSTAILREVEGIIRKVILSLLYDEPASHENGAVVERATWHAVDINESCRRLGTSGDNGLTRSEVAQRQLVLGRNVLRPIQPPSDMALFMAQLHNLPSILLVATAALSFLTGGTVDALLIGGVLLVNSGIAFKTEKSAQSIISSIDTPRRLKVTVLRDGIEQRVPDSELVDGDVIRIRAGLIPADARLLTARRLTVDESPLTGESLPVSKSPELVRLQQCPLSARTNMVFRGTMATGGEALAVVVATGGRTEIGRIQRLVAGTIAAETPLQKDLRLIGKQGIIFTSFICGGVLVAGLMRGKKFADISKIAISLGVAAIPEGLPAVGTTTLAFGVRRMQQHNILIKNLSSVETLGAVDVICLDKTGTLTLNEMTLVEVRLGGERYEFHDGMFINSREKITKSADVENLLLMTCLCNEVRLKWESGTLVFKGSPTESAFYRAAIAAGFSITTLDDDYPRYATELRTENKPYMKTLHKGGRLSDRLAAIKGSPPEVLERCSTYWEEGRVRKMTVSKRAAIVKENQEMTGNALRVLGVASRHFKEGEAYHREWTWLGLVGLWDPPREGMTELVDQLRGCGLQPCMMTGDQPSTAQAIGALLHIHDGHASELMDGKDLESLNSEILAARVGDVHVFSRVSPSGKLRIVEAFQRGGKVVAMTGDGINDSPALKAADVGIAMGRNGTDAARQAADIVVADDRLQTLMQAVGQGRALRENLRRSVHFILSTNMSESLVTLGALLFGAGSPFDPKQLLWINLVTDIFPSLALALEGPANGEWSMRRSVGDSIVSSDEKQAIMREALVLTAGTLLSHAMARKHYGKESPEASTVASLALVAGQMLHAWSARSEEGLSWRLVRENPQLLGASLGGFVAQLATIIVPSLRDVMGYSKWHKQDSVAVLAGALAPLAVNEITKWARLARRQVNNN